MNLILAMLAVQLSCTGHEKLFQPKEANNREIKENDALSGP